MPKRNAPPYSIVGIVTRMTPASIFDVLEISIPFPPQGLDAYTFETNQRKPSRASALRNLEGICSTDQAARLAASAVHGPATCLVATLKRFQPLILRMVMIGGASPAWS